ncbi:T9SS type B sorting domain-containing protein [Chryseobacterium potabilaquae]|uniref:Gliding motility-associated C-terminal domain-containing protein n=1 Tax=Chryseobacterium potabilaquae TaxID=2675057 RepID=A0A6N4XBL2_9FLAO|nr:T9SS type B sorting domain-containing protein [Chryseobacterium potabilaquae]CAA7197038.1 hypothetical protein CHRY9293_03095 [Chryseobacterium potabilaquae]
MKKLLLLFILFLSQLYFSQSDCVSSIPVCGNSNISYTPSGHGDVEEDLSSISCLASDENFSVWYKFTVATSGTLAFVIDSNVNNDDYDFAVFGPNTDCSNLGNAIRCNYAPASPTGNTGLELTDSNSQWFEPYMDVVAGETYYLIVDNYSNSANGFSLTWSGTATLTSAFTDTTLAPNPFIVPGVPAANPSDPNYIVKCVLPSQFNFTTLTNGILNGNTGFTITYHTNANDAITGNAPITTTTVNAGEIFYYRIIYEDLTNPDNPANGCFQSGKFTFKQGDITPERVTLYACNNNNAGTGTFNLNTANVYPAEPNAVKKFYLTLADLNADVNAITNVTNYVSGVKTLYVKVQTSEGCVGNTTVNLDFFPVSNAHDATIESCFIESNTVTASFDLNTANVTTLTTGVTKQFYLTLANAISGTNPINNPSNYISQNTDVYVRVFTENNCYAISKITLKVLPPVKSTILQNKTICVENTTTLDAGPGFDEYEWSTGATTQSISNVGVGSYWVKLKTGPCFTLQQVQVYASQQPVIGSIDITNNTITINVTGGVGPYQYSLDGITWQNSNVFTGLPRGEVKVYVKDSFNCIPVDTQITVPNLLNAITPNGDNKNDYIDYSALAYKKNLEFIVYDRYGNKLYTADKNRDYKWDGTAFGKKIITGTYWYTITWNENDKNNTQTKYSGWVLVKSR